MTSIYLTLNDDIDIKGLKDLGGQMTVMLRCGGAVKITKICFPSGWSVVMDDMEEICKDGYFKKNHFRIIDQNGILMGYGNVCADGGYPITTIQKM